MSSNRRVGCGDAAGVLSGIGRLVMNMPHESVVGRRKACTERRTKPVYPMVSRKGSRSHGASETPRWVERTPREQRAYDFRPVSENSRNPSPHFVQRTCKHCTK